MRQAGASASPRVRGSQTHVCGRPHPGPRMSASTLVGTSKRTSPAVKKAFAAKACALERAGVHDPVTTPTGSCRHFRTDSPHETAGIDDLERSGLPLGVVRLRFERDAGALGAHRNLL